MWACRTSPAAEPPKGAHMKQIIALAVFVLCFGVGTARAQRAGGSMPVGGGNTNANPNQGGGGGGAGGGGGGGSSAIAGVAHHPVWVPPPNVSAKNDGPFLPSTFQSFDKAVELGKAEAGTREPSIVEVARMTQEQKATAVRARIRVEQDVAGRMQEIPAQ
jgi:hypothetical protein